MQFIFPILLLTAILLTIIEWFRATETTFPISRELGWSAAILTANFFGTALLYAVGGQNWLQMQVSILLLDLAAAALLIWIALQSRQYWPLWVAGLHFPVVIAVVLPMTGANINSFGQGLTQGLWSYPQLLIIVAVALHCRRLRMKQIVR